MIPGIVTHLRYKNITNLLTILLFMIYDYFCLLPFMKYSLYNFIIFYNP